jgi:hypothetical protein
MILIYERGGILKTVEFDATPRRVHLGTATPAVHPVQDEPNKTDDVHPEPVRLSAECFVSNTPTVEQIGGVRGAVSDLTINLTTREYVTGARASGGPGPQIPGTTTSLGSPVEVDPAQYEERSTTITAPVLQFPEPFNRVRDVHEELDSLRRNKTRVQVVTTLKTYDAMVITSLSSPETAMDAIRFGIELQEVFVGEATLVDAPQPLQKRAQKPKAQGSQATYELPEQQQDLLGQGLERLANMSVDSGIL